MYFNSKRLQLMGVKTFPLGYFIPPLMYQIIDYREIHRLVGPVDFHIPKDMGLGGAID